MMRIILFLLICIPHFIFGQTSEKPYWQYEVSHGLPSNSLYEVMVDSRDRVWFGSDNGVTCYDGTQFNTHTIEDGLAENKVVRCFEDNLGRININFLLTKENLICEIIDNGPGFNHFKKHKPYHQSTGINNTKERMKLFEELHKKEISLEVLELNKNGLLIRITMPKLTRE